MTTVTTCKRPKSAATRAALMNLAQSLTKEKHIEQTCSQWLELDGWRTLKTDPVSRKEWGKGFGELGMADRLYLRYEQPGEVKLARAMEKRRPLCWTEVMWIEWKSPRGKPFVKQLAWHAAESARGALTLIAGRDFERSIEGFQAFYRASGLMRRKIGMSGFYRFGAPGEDTVAHINTGRKPSGERCAMPRFEKDNPQFGDICGRRSVALCDGPKCDKPICELHRTKHQTKSNTDFCPDHKEMAGA